MSWERWECPVEGCDVYFAGECREEWGRIHMVMEHAEPTP